MNTDTRLGKRLVAGFFLLTFFFQTTFGLQSIRCGGNRNDKLTAVCATKKDQGYVVAGWTESLGAGGKDAWVRKYDANNKLLWEKVYGGKGDEEVSDILEDEKGDLVFCGYTMSIGADDKDVWIVKLTKKGVLKWQKTFGGTAEDFGRSVKDDYSYNDQDAYLVSGITRSKGKGGSDILMISVDANSGSLIRETTCGTTGDDVICRANMGNGLLVPWSSTENGIVSNWMYEFSYKYPNDDTLKKLSYNRSMLASTCSGEYAGYWMDSLSQPTTGFCSYDVKDSAVNWENSPAKSLWEITDMQTQTTDQSILAAATHTMDGNTSGLVFRISKNYGDLVGFNTPDWGKGKFNSFSRVTRLGDNTYVAVGYTQPVPNNHSDGWLVHFDENDLSYYKQYGENESGIRILGLKSKNIAVLSSYSDNRAQIQLFDPIGKPIWTHKTMAKVFSYNLAGALLELSNGTLVASTFDSIFGIDANGKRIFSLPLEDYRIGMAIVNENQFVVGSDKVRILYTNKGQEIDRRLLEKHDHSDYFKANTIAFLKDGSQVIGGYIYSSRQLKEGTTTFNNDCPVVMKFSKVGKMIWEKEINPYYGQINALTETADGTIFACGSGLKPNPLRAATLVCQLDSTGNLLMKSVFNIGNSGKTVFALPDSSVIIQTGKQFIQYSLNADSYTCYNVETPGDIMGSSLFGKYMLYTCSKGYMPSHIVIGAYDLDFIPVNLSKLE
jgi:hypothetical protein